ncbi:MAG: hypothetical protein ACHQIL_08290 [Steroidobacterales bacterium]
MSATWLQLVEGRVQSGCKGPRAAEWLAGLGIPVPAAPNSHASTPDDLFVARLGSSEFFVEQGAPGDSVHRIAAALAASPAGVYPVLREDWAMTLSGAAAEEMLAQVCNINFAALDPGARPVIMTLMVGVAVLVVPCLSAAGRSYRIWCDPTYGPYLRDALQGVVVECGGTYTGVTA